MNDTNNKCEGENRRLKEILNVNTSVSVAVKKLFQHSLSQDFEVSSASVIASMSSVCFRDANPLLTSLYSLFSSHAVELMIQDHVVHPLCVETTDGGFDCRDSSGVCYRVKGRPLTCSCPFFMQTSLSCCHVVSVFTETSDVFQEDIYDVDNRWLKSHVADVSCARVAPVILRSFVGPETRHH